MYDNYNYNIYYENMLGTYIYTVASFGLRQRIHLLGSILQLNFKSKSFKNINVFKRN